MKFLLLLLSPPFLVDKLCKHTASTFRFFVFSLSLSLSLALLLFFLLSVFFLCRSELTLNESIENRGKETNLFFFYSTIGQSIVRIALIIKPYSLFLFVDRITIELNLRSIVKTVHKCFFEKEKNFVEFQVSDRFRLSFKGKEMKSNDFNIDAESIWWFFCLISHQEIVEILHKVTVHCVLLPWWRSIELNQSFFFSFKFSFFLFK